MAVRKSAPTRKQVTMLVRVSVPAGMSAAQARLEVKTLISEQCNFSADYGDVKALRCSPAPTTRSHPA